jgi:hypothetical protein
MNGLKLQTSNGGTGKSRLTFQPAWNKPKPIPDVNDTCNNCQKTLLFTVKQCERGETVIRRPGLLKTSFLH